MQLRIFEARPDRLVGQMRGGGSQREAQSRRREWELQSGRTIAGPSNPDELGQRLHIPRRSTLCISPIAKRLVEPPIAAAYGHAALLASGLPCKAEARSEVSQRSSILIE